MNLLLFALVAVAGGVGASARFLVDGVIRSRVKTSFPLATTVINVSGSLLIGIVTGLALGAFLPEQWQLVLGTGLLGGYTTFSTASFETVRLIQAGRYLPAVANGLGMFVASVVAAGFGLWIGSLPG